jgi:hypothetical protein
METWEEARINRLEDRISRIERREWKRREAIFRLITNAFVVAMIVLATAAVVLAAAHHGH